MIDHRGDGQDYYGVLNQRSREIGAAMRAVNDQLTWAGLGYHVEGSVMSSSDAVDQILVMFVYRSSTSRSIAVPAPLVRGGQVDRVRLAGMAAQIATRSDAKIREAARAAWQDLFGEPLTAIVDL